MAKGQYKKIGGYLAAIGGILAVVLGLLGALSFIPVSTLGPLQPPLILVLRIAVGLIVLVTSGVIDIDALKLERSGIVLLLLGIVLIPIGDWLGGFVTIIGAILMMI